MDDIKRFLCSREDCIAIIEQSIKSKTRKETIAQLPDDVFLSIANQVKKNFCGCNYDKNGVVYAFDELDPEEIAVYLIEQKNYEADFEAVKDGVCRELMSKINEFYKTLKTNSDGIDLRMDKNLPPSDYYKKYRAICESRQGLKLKRLRGI